MTEVVCLRRAMFVFVGRVMKVKVYVIKVNYYMKNCNI